MAPGTIEFSTSLIIEAPLEQLWPLLSDTDRINRLLHLPPSEQVEPNADLSRTIRGHFVGVPVSWREFPFEWVFEQWFEVTRAFDAPFPVEQLVTRTLFTTLGASQTRVEVQVELAPRNIIGGQPARLFIEQKFLRDMRRIYRQLGDLAIAAGKVIIPPGRRPTVNTGRLERGATRLRQFGVRQALIQRLTNHLAMADDLDVIKMRPFALADQWEEPRVEVLRLFLYATRSGLLDLEWDVICPGCRGASSRLPKLGDLINEAHCPSCNIRYDVDFEESVELRFSVSPDIRDAADISYCIGGPANTRHIVTQLWLEPGANKQVRVRLTPGSYRLRSRQFPGRALLEVTEQGQQAMQVRFNGQEIVIPNHELLEGEITLDLVNESPASLLIILEQSAWNLQAVSAAFVTSLDEFRQLFSSEVLAPGLGIAIRNLTFLFSDLKDSTAIYDRIGDSPAYARVRDHFDVMRSIIGRHSGALVKTIGDAVMAVFRSSEDALEAAIEMQQEFIAGEIARGNPSLRVKLGLHRGPCIAVNANDLLDYFGSTVNIAARVQSESIGGDIVLTEAMLSDPGVQQVIIEYQPETETFERTLKGFNQVFTLSRLWVRVPSADEHEDHDTMVAA